MFEKLNNDSIVLERIKLTDSELIYRALIHSRKEISPWLSWLTPNYDIKCAEKFINLQLNNWNDNLEYTYTIKNHQSELLGVIGLHLFDTQNDVANVGYWMNSLHTGNGHCTAALKLLIENSLKPLNLIRIEVIVAVQNIASQKVAENAGAKYEFTLKNRIRINGIATDAKMYAFT